ncbi:beta-1,3-galactosyltransferase 5-like [Haliotis rufescens]|uniref:beta-1,3-galactosyltransferase 5-like n=1 Tax=Haliotis rufescens TaxID=6454 RepID=UPI00201F55D3|nr:beta-1,3-galactosyltransferase 5-like [Haliotis rufescens]
MRRVCWKFPCMFGACLFCVILYDRSEVFPTEEYFIPRKEILNRLNYDVLLSPAHNSCSLAVDLLVFVLSVVKDREKRSSIRNTWGRVDNTWPLVNFGRSVKVVFLFGVAPTPEENLELKSESRMHNDVLQINVTESYFIPTLKIMMAFKWMKERCSKVRYVMKTDDDVFVNLPFMMERVESINGRFILGDRLPRALCHRSGKHTVSPKEYPFVFYPAYLIGYAYIMPAEVTLAMLNAFYRMPFLKIEDVYIGGILPRATRTSVLQIHPSWYENGQKVDICDFSQNKLIAGANIDNNTIFRIWQTFKEPWRCRK